MDTQTAISRLQASKCPEAWAFLYREYRTDVQKLATRLLRSADEAEDMTEELFLQLPHRLRRYDPAVGEFEPWLLTVAANFAKSWAIKIRGPETEPLVDEAEVLAGLEFGRLPRRKNLMRVQQNQERALERLHDGISVLRPKDQRAIEQFLAGYSSIEVAKNSNEPPRSARRRLHRAVKHLRQAVLS